MFRYNLQDITSLFYIKRQKNKIVLSQVLIEALIWWWLCDSVFRFTLLLLSYDQPIG